MTPDQPNDLLCVVCQKPLIADQTICCSGECLEAEIHRQRNSHRPLPAEPAKPEGETVDQLHRRLQREKRTYAPSEMLGRATKLENELTALRAELAETDKAFGDSQQALVVEINEVERLRAENERLREDTERMDWMEREGHSLEWSDQCHGVMRSSDGKTFFGDDLREAISAAIRDELPAAPTEPTDKEP